MKMSIVKMSVKPIETKTHILEISLDNARIMTCEVQTHLLSHTIVNVEMYGANANAHELQAISEYIQEQYAKGEFA